MQNITETHTFEIPSFIPLTKVEKENLMRLFDSIYETTGIDPKVYMETKSQKATPVYLRQISAYLMRKYTRLTLREIGIIQGYRDHSSVIHSRDKVEAWMGGAPGYGYEKKLTEEIIKKYEQRNS